MEQNEGRLGGLCASRNGPKVNHLLFVYDSMLFIRNSTSEAQRLKQILHLYTQSSGQLVNYDKSTVYFSPSIPASDRDHISTILHIREVHDLGIYLGVPLAVGINKTAALGFVRDKYVMSCYILPQNLVDDMSQSIQRYWWSGRDNKCGWPFLA
ncbi:hypothetical protein V6N12_015084 [Hibiscus sabdariffa]|uniref:Reverse transcriptase domain-containing protein n=1 Tax=Hibiscus sabdariffa TaxID=183260 RepID=A0ABR2DM38_9ROSI